MSRERSFILRNCPILLRPKLLALRNHWRGKSQSASIRFRDGFLILFGLLVMYGIFRGMLWMLGAVEADKAFVYLPPGLPLGLIFLYLMMMLFLSNGASAVASLYLSQDLDLVLSCPVRPGRFFRGKMLDVLFSSSWITFIFLLPALFSYARFYHASWDFYGMLILVLPPYFLIPCLLSILVVTIYAKFVPLGRTRVTRKAIGVFFVLGILLLGDILFRQMKEFSISSMDDVLKVVVLLSLPNTIWLPSYWVTNVLGETLVPTHGVFLPYLLLLYSFSAFLAGLTFLAVRWGHFDAYSQASSDAKQQGATAGREGPLLRILLSPFSRQMKALILKEYRMFARDSTQLFQLLLLSGICVLYFYNFRFIQGLRASLPPERHVWWGIFSSLLNSYIESFLIAAVGTRFVFQSISLEGSSYWILQTSPLDVRQILRAKFLAWVVPISLILCLVFGVGVLAIGETWGLVLLKVFSTACITYGVVGLGVGLGAYFANFQWEHPSQLAASFGSLVYMLSAVGLVSLSTGILALLLLFRHYQSFIGLGSPSEFALIVISLLGLLAYLNFFVARFCIKLGERELERRRD